MQRPEYLQGNNQQGDFGIQHFQKTIRDLKASESDLANTVHLEGIDPELLSVEDENMWNKTHDVLTQGKSVEDFIPELYAYRDGAHTETRRLFAGLLANKLTELSLKQQMAKYKKQLFE